MNIELRGLDNLERLLGSMASAETLRPGMERAVLNVKAEVMRYPRQRIGSSYTRTHVLENAWDTIVTTVGGNVQGRIGNNIEYGPFVKSRRFQAQVHRGRWATVEDVVESGRIRARVTEFLQDEIDQVLGD